MLNGTLLMALVGVSFGSKCLDTLRFPVDPHKLDRPHIIGPNVLNQDVIVGKDSGDDNRCPDTNAINPLSVISPTPLGRSGGPIIMKHMHTKSLKNEIQYHSRRPVTTKQISTTP